MVGVGVGTAGAAASGETPDAATQSAVTVGMITDGGGSSAIGTAALVEQGAKAAVSYLNAYGDGLDGHKVTLYVCENQSTPAGGQTCANDMVQHGVVAVVEPFTGQGATEVPTIVAAGIPYITVSGGSTAELTTAGAYDLEGGFPAYLGAMALSAKAHGLKKVTFLVENVPAAIQGAQVFGALVYKAAGVGFAVVPVNEGTADISPQMQSAVSGGADAVGMVGDVTLCTSFLQAYNTLGLKLPKYVLSTCQDPSILDSPTLDKALTGSYITTSAASSKADNARVRLHDEEVRAEGEREPEREQQPGRRRDAGARARRHHEGLDATRDRGRCQGGDGSGDERHHPAVRRLDVHLQRHGHPAAQVRVLGERRHRGRPERQVRQGRLGEGVQPDATVLGDASIAASVRPPSGS